MYGASWSINSPLSHTGALRDRGHLQIGGLVIRGLVACVTALKTVHSVHGGGDAPGKNHGGDHGKANNLIHRYHPPVGLKIHMVEEICQEGRGNNMSDIALCEHCKSDFGFRVDGGHIYCKQCGQEHQPAVETTREYCRSRGWLPEQRSKLW